eukprot:1830114-Rhodomonas_salina.3
MPPGSTIRRCQYQTIHDTLGQYEHSQKDSVCVAVCGYDLEPRRAGQDPGHDPPCSPAPIADSESHIHRTCQSELHTPARVSSESASLTCSTASHKHTGMAGRREGEREGRDIGGRQGGYFELDWLLAQDCLARPSMREFSIRHDSLGSSS